jgi:hypothetical protein
MAARNGGNVAAASKMSALIWRNVIMKYQLINNGVMA